jgi:matrixin
MASDGVPRLCIDRVLPDEYAPARSALERALAASAARGRAEPGVVDASRPLPTQRLALVTLKMWEADRVLRCRFLDGNAAQRKRVEAKAHMWEQYANVKFKFVRTTDEEIRISFVADPGSWSAVGTDALVERYFPRYQPTMNYGWLRDDTDDEEYERVVVHEFGHALGCIHEHQSPKATLKWNKPEVYRTFSGPPNFWDKATIDHNILERYSRQQTNASRFDPDSIMLYSFPGNLFAGGVGTKNNTHLSAGDKAFIAKMYPPGPSSN